MRRVITAGLVALTLAGSVFAQDYFQFQRRFQRSAKFATAESFDGAFNFCRLFYTSVRSEYGGQGWWTDYPDADTNFMIRLSELTKTPKRLNMSAIWRANLRPRFHPKIFVFRESKRCLFPIKVLMSC